jgi:ElaB/YqjD/DUF883 family membrane-anchored ribosome-binding protein
MFGSSTRVSDVSSEIDTLRSDLSRLASAVGGLVSDQARATSSDAQSAWSSLGKTVSSRASDAYDKASRWSSRGSDMASDAADSLQKANSHLEDTIERNPIAAVLVAAGIGLAIGLMSRSRS